jgi:exosortase N
MAAHTRRAVDLRMGLLSSGFKSEIFSKMIALSRSLIKPHRMIMLAILLAYLIIIRLGLPTYIDAFSVNTILGITAIIFTWQGTATGNRIFGWRVAAGILLLLYHWVPSKFILYITIGISIFSLMETMAGKAGRLALVCLIFMSPLCEYFVNVFGFPIRLKLTQIAGHILHSMDSGYHTEGNTLLKGTAEFSVDTACMGLHMLISSLLTGMILLGIYQRRLNKKLSPIYLGGIALTIFILNLFSNLVRIISLVEFHVMPENEMHSAIGLACFVIYVLLPSVILMKYMVRRFGKMHEWQTVNFEVSPKLIRIQIALLIVIFPIVIAGKDRSMNYYLAAGTVKVPGYRIENLPDAIVKLSTEKGLVYLKPIMGFYSSDHQPAMCWKGSGYVFKKLEATNVDGQMVYTSCLEKGSDRLYTTWWYDNGNLQTISQFTWRWDSFRNNRPWALVNVTADSKPELFNQIRQIRRINPCRMLLNPE